MYLSTYSHQAFLRQFSTDSPVILPTHLATWLKENRLAKADLCPEELKSTP